jgi:hypothetical protein
MRSVRDSDRADRIGHLIEVNHARLTTCVSRPRCLVDHRARRLAGNADARRASSYKIWALAAAETLGVAVSGQVVPRAGC